MLIIIVYDISPSITSPIAYTSANMHRVSEIVMII